MDGGEQEQRAAAFSGKSEAATANTAGEEERKASESEEESSYYDEEEESEQEEGQDKSEPKTQEIIDVSGNLSEAQRAEMEAQQVFENAKKKQEAAKNFDQNELFKRMKVEWDQLQANPTELDAQIKAQLDMLQQIDNTALAANTVETEEQTEASKLVQKVIEEQSKNVGTTSITAEYRSKGEPFLDL